MMRALMFGWEFPPHILGGLGTASYGLTKGMSLQEDMETIFVIPKPHGDEDQSFLRIIGACNTPVVWRDVPLEKLQERLGSTVTTQEYYDLRKHIYADFRYLYTNDIGCIEFSGRYPDNLLEEIKQLFPFAPVSLPAKNSFDVIHSHDWLTYPAGIHAKNVSGKPLVIHVHATDFDRSRGKVNPQVYSIEKKRDGLRRSHTLCQRPHPKYGHPKIPSEPGQGLYGSQCRGAHQQRHPEHCPCTQYERQDRYFSWTHHPAKRPRIFCGSGGKGVGKKTGMSVL